MDGIYVNGRRCPSKKALKEAVKDGNSRIEIENTSMFGGGFSGDIKNAPVGEVFTVVGPDPYRERKWYANVTRKADGTVKVS